MKKKKTILIVEDERALMQALSEKIQKSGFKVIEAVNGLEGLQLSVKYSPDLILLDIVMPKMDGMTMIKELRNKKQGKNIPVIFLTNLSGLENTEEVEKNNVNNSTITQSMSLSSLRGNTNSTSNLNRISK